MFFHIMRHFIKCLFVFILIVFWIIILFGFILWGFFGGEFGGILRWIFQKPEFEFLVGFEKNIEFFCEVFVPLFVRKLELVILVILSTLFCEIFSGLQLPFIFLEEPSDQFTDKGVKLRPENALLKVVRSDFFHIALWRFWLSLCEITTLPESHLPVQIQP